MKLKIIACNVLFREISHWAARSPHRIDVKYLTRSLHNDPDDLRVALQAEIDSTVSTAEDDELGHDAIVFGYALCSNAAAYLKIRDVPVVLPRAHDCITLFLGSRDRYRESFNGSPGTYYYTSGWIERAGTHVERTSTEGNAANSQVYEDYVRRFGEESAKYLMDTLHSWWKNYHRAAFIEMRLPDADRFESVAKAQATQVAKDFGWEFETLAGEHNLIRKLVDGEWDPTEFLVAQPGTQILPSYDDDVVNTSTEFQPIPPRAARVM